MSSENYRIIAYGGNKAIGIMENLGLSKYVIAIYELESGDLNRLFDMLLKGREDTQRTLKYAEGLYKESRNRMIIEIKKLVEK